MLTIITYGRYHSHFTDDKTQNFYTLITATEVGTDKRF